MRDSIHLSRLPINASACESLLYNWSQNRARLISWGFTTKNHILCDGHVNPLHFYLTGGQATESTVFDILSKQADAAIHDTNGRPIA